MLGAMPYGSRPYGTGTPAVLTEGPAAQLVAAAACRVVAVAGASSGIVFAGRIGVSASSAAALTSAVTLGAAARLNCSSLATLRSGSRLVGALGVSATGRATLGGEISGALLVVAEDAVLRPDPQDRPLCGLGLTDGAPFRLALGEALQ